MPGEDTSVRADKLARHLRLAFEKEQVRIARPMPRRELIVSGFDESATPYELNLALAEAGECASTDVRSVSGSSQANEERALFYVGEVPSSSSN